MKIAVCQYDAKWERKECNKDRIEQLLVNCPRREVADWLIFPEMTLSGFTMNRAVSELSPEDHAFFTGLAAENNINVSYGGVEKGYNNLITLDRRGRRVNACSKIHLFSFAGEDKAYKAGSSPEVFELEGLRVAPAVCFDLRFPYVFWSRAGKADIYAVIAAWPKKRAEHWTTLLRARAIENQAYCVGVNRTGFEGETEYAGNSLCFDPLGGIVLDAGSGEGVFLADGEVTKDAVAEAREKLPFLKEGKGLPWTGQ